MTTIQDHRGSLWPDAEAMVPYEFQLPLRFPAVRKTKPEPKPVPPEAEIVSVEQCCRVFCIGRSKLYELLADGPPAYRSSRH